MSAVEPHEAGTDLASAAAVPEGALCPGQRPLPGRRGPREPWTGEGEPAPQLEEQGATPAPSRRRRQARWGGGGVLNITSRDGARTQRRITGVDAARGAALIGMVAVHTLPAADEQTGSPTLQWLLFGGNASAIFAVLAGVAVSFLVGGRRQRTRRRLRRAQASLFVRALLLLAWGLLMNLLPNPVFDILPYYALLFLLALPFTQLRVRYLIASAVVVAVAGPLLRHAVLRVAPVTEHMDPTPTDLVTDPVGLFTYLLFTGVYPAATSLAFILVGMALGRLMLRKRAVQLTLVGIGGALAALGTGGSWLLVNVLGGMRAITENSAVASPRMVWETMVYGPDVTLPADTLWWQLVAGPHANTTLSLVAATGMALMALGGVLWISRVAGDVLRPLASLGSMTLTGYSLHLALLAMVDVTEHPALWFWLMVVLGALAAVAWQRAVGRGPLESAVSALSRHGGAVLIRPDGRRSRG